MHLLPTPMPMLAWKELCSFWDDQAELASLRDDEADALALFESERHLADQGWIRFIEDEGTLVLTSSRVAYLWPPESMTLVP